jgi:hypothetical protein
MLSIRGIYDGGKIKFLDNIKIEGPKDVIITFLDKEASEITQDELYILAEKNGSLDFLKEPGEDIYTDKNLKRKY